jgi:hypothetical protein
VVATDIGLPFEGKMDLAGSTGTDPQLSDAEAALFDDSRSLLGHVSAPMTCSTYRVAGHGRAGCARCSRLPTSSNPQGPKVLFTRSLSGPELTLPACRR